MEDEDADETAAEEPADTEQHSEPPGVCAGVERAGKAPQRIERAKVDASLPAID